MKNEAAPARKRKTGGKGGKKKNPADTQNMCLMSDSPPEDSSTEEEDSSGEEEDGNGEEEEESGEEES